MAELVQLLIVDSWSLYLGMRQGVVFYLGMSSFLHILRLVLTWPAIYMYACVLPGTNVTYDISPRFYSVHIL